MRYLSFIFLFLSSIVSAADYSWNYNGAGISSSAAGACEYSVSVSYGWTFVSAVIMPHNPAAAWCYAKTAANPNPQEFSTVVRSGNTCPEGSTYNTSTGACDFPAPDDGEWCSAPGNTTKTFIVSKGVCVAPADADLKDQCKAFAKSPDSGNSVVTTWRYPESDQEGYRNPKKTENSIGCELQLLEDISCVTKPAFVDCTQKQPDGSCFSSPKALKCKTNAVLTGNVAPDPFGTPAGTTCSGDECTLEPPEQIKEEKPCTYVYDAEGRKSCDSWTFTGKEGAEQCGTVGGVFSCKNDLPKAVGKGLSISTDISEEHQPDGGKKITKTDTAKQVTCVGTQACTTKVTVNKTVVIKGSDGSTQSTTGTCTGSSCASGQNPDGNGDGFGDCTGDSCSKDEEGSFVLGPKTPELEKQDTYAETTQKFINRAKASPLVSGLSGISMPSGGSCSIGSAQTWFGSIDFSSFCQLAPQVLAGLRYLFLAIWAWAAIRLFFTA